MASDAAICDAMAKRARCFARAMMRSHYALPSPAGGAPFSVRTAALVKAAHPSVCGLVPLSLVDTELYMICGPSSSTLFFREALDCGKLQSTLALALEAFPVLAGRVVSLPPAGAAEPQQRRTGEWRRGYPRAVDCNNAGAAFTVLDLPGVALPEDRNAETAPPFPTMDQGLHLKDMTDNPDAVIFDVLVVNYASGCMLSVSASHAIVDGTSGAAFLHFWSALLRGAPLAALPKPLLDRAVYDAACGVAGQVCAARQAAEAKALRERSQPGCCGGGRTSEPAPPAAATLVQPPAEDDASPAAPSPRDDSAAAVPKPSSSKKKGAAAAALPETSPLKGITVWPSVGGWTRLLLRMATDSTLGMVRGHGTVIRLVLRFPAAELARLKAVAVAGAAAAGQADEAARLSTNDVLCAAIWRALAQSRRKRGPLDSAASGAATFCFVANTRQLILPPEQQLFIGNAVVIAQAELPAAQLRAGSLADAAAALRAAKARITAEAVRAEMAFVQAHADSRVTLGDAARNLRWNTLPYDGGCGMWDWTKFPIYALDFGGGCKPFWLEPGLGAPMLLPYVMGAAPAPDGDGLVVYANAPRDEAGALLQALRAQ